MKDNARDKFWRKAIAETGKKLRFLPEGKLNANLEFCGDFAEAYRVGAEEAQGEIETRLRALQLKLSAPQQPTRQCPECRQSDCACGQGYL